MKKLIRIVLCCSLLTLILCGCGDKSANQTVKSESDMIEATTDSDSNSGADATVAELETDKTSEAENDINLTEYFIEQSGVSEQEILFSSIDDFDGDSVKEAFFFVGEDIGDEIYSEYTGNMWFTNGKTVTKLDESRSGSWRTTGTTISLGNKKYVYADEFYVTASVSMIWKVVDGEVVADSISGAGAIESINGNNIDITASAYDGMYDGDMGLMLAHTWKKYYFYYDESDDCIKEYGGALIPKNQIDGYCGFDLVEQLEKDDYVITTAYYRENGILNVNYLQYFDNGSIDFKNANYDCKNKQFVIAWDGNSIVDSNYGGIYRGSLIYNKDVVTYPEVEKESLDLWIELKINSDVVGIGDEVLIHGIGDDDTDYYFVVDYDTVFAENNGKADDYYQGLSPVDWFYKVVMDKDTDPLRLYSISTTNGHIDVINEVVSWGYKFD